MIISKYNNFNNLNTTANRITYNTKDKKSVIFKFNSYSIKYFFDKDVYSKTYHFRSLTSHNFIETFCLLAYHKNNLYFNFCKLKNSKKNLVNHRKKALLYNNKIKFDINYLNYQWSHELKINLICTKSYLNQLIFLINEMIFYDFQLCNY